MAKQPYIPFYIGDYIRDTRMLPLNVRGGWVELIIQSWDNKGELTGTIEEFSRLMSCSIEETNLVIQTLNQKNIFGYTLLDDGRIKIEVRKIKKMQELSEIRKNTGSLGGNPKLKKKLLKVKDNLIPEYEYEYESDIESIVLRDGYKKWIEFRKSKNKSISPTAMKAQIKFLKSHPVDDACKIIDQSIMNDWQGLFELKKQTQYQTSKPHTYKAPPMK